MVPPAGRASIVNDPPSSVARCRIESRPTPRPGVRRRAGAVIADGECGQFPGGAEGDLAVPGAGVPAHVGQRLPGDAQDRGLRRRGQRRDRPDIYADVQAAGRGELARAGPQRLGQAQVVQDRRAQVIDDAADVGDGGAQGRTCGPSAAAAAAGRCRSARR